MNLASCTNDAVEAVSEDCAIQLTTQVEPSTRGTNTDLQSTQIVAGRQIGVTITGHITDSQGGSVSHNNVLWTAGENGALTNTGDPVYYGDGTVNIVAYHPYLTNSEFDDNGYFYLKVSEDQSTDEGYLNSDWLYVKKSNVAKSESPIPLTFYHAMAKIVVTLTSDDIKDLSNAEVYICGTKNNAKVVIEMLNACQTYSNFASDDPVEIKAGVTTDDTKTVTAIIVPQKVESGKFIKVALNGKTYSYSLPQATTFSWKGSYNYTLKLIENKTELKLMSEQITPWDSKPVSIYGDAEEEV